MLSCERRPPRGRASAYAASVLACVLGMGVKEVMVTAPILVLWYDRAMVAGSWREIFARRKFYYLALFSTWAAWPCPCFTCRA